MKELGKYSFGIGDRFAHQAKAQLEALIMAQQQGVHITPVWNKSYREHATIKSLPAKTREQADLAVKNLEWEGSYFVDADHVGLKTVDFFMDSSDFFTLDVADFIGEKAASLDIENFINFNKKYLGTLVIPGISEKFNINESMLEQAAQKYLSAVLQAGKIYRHILNEKPKDSFIIEISMDETAEPQTPIDLFFILSAIAREGIPVQTIAPKFSGRFNKGVDYAGDVNLFDKEFEQDVAVVQFAIKEFSLPSTLKLSIHSGSDKFSIYPSINKAIKKFNAGLHLKTAGTTWLEELIGLAEAGGEGLDIAKDIFGISMNRFEELCSPYATVLDIDKKLLPSVEQVNSWDSRMFVNSLRHDLSREEYNKHFRQLLHVGYKIAAEMGERYLKALEKYETVIGKNVSKNIYERHVIPLFLD